MATFVDDGKERVNTGSGLTGASRGIKAPDVKTSVKEGSFIGDVGAGVADLIEMGAKTTDKYFQNEMDITIEDTQAQIAENYGVNAAVDIMEKPDGTPDMDRAITKITRLRDAMQNGLLPKSTYDAQVLALTKSARSSYGRGHREIFDRKLEDATGVSQNTLRKNLMSELSSLADGASESNKAWLAQLNKDRDMLPPADLQLMSADPVKFKEKYPTAESIAFGAAPLVYEKQVVDRSNMILDNKDKQLKMSDADVGRTVDEGLAGVLNQTFMSVAGSLPDGQDFFTMVDNLRKNPTPEATNELRLMTGQLRDQYAKNLTNVLERSRLSSEEKRKRMDDHMKMFDLNIGSVTDGNYGALGILKAEFEANRDGAQRRFSATDVGQTLLAFNAAGPYIANSVWENLISGQKGQPANTVMLDVAKAIRAGKNPLEAIENMKLTGDQVVNVHKAYIDAIAASGDSPEAATELANVIFGEKNTRFFARISDPKVRSRTWAMLNNPEMQKALQQGSGLNYRKYKDFVKSSFPESAKRDLGAIGDLETTIGRPIMKYDAVNGRFALIETESINIDPRQAGLKAQAQTNIDSLNIGLSVLDPVLKSDSVDKEAYIRTMTAGKKIPGMPLPGMSKAGAISPEEMAETDVATGKQVSPDAGTRLEMKEMMDLYNKTEDPELKKLLKDEIFNLSTGTESTEAAPIKRNGQSNLGGPIDVVKVAQSPAATEVIDLLTGAPSFIEALKSGDAATIAAAVASVIPFPGAKIGKAKEAIEKVGEVIDPIVLEGKRIAKELEAAPARDAQALKDMEASGSLRRQSFERMDNLSFDDMIKYEGELRSGASNRVVTLPKAGSNKKDWSDTDKLGVKSLKEKLDRLLVADGEGGNNAEEIAKISRYLRKLDLEVVK